MLAIGDTMPSVRVFDDGGNAVEIADLVGRPLVLWFYPKDDTPG
jgi:peroxiredoxin Q/BCP